MARKPLCAGCNRPILISTEEREALATGDVRAIFCVLCTKTLSVREREQIAEAVVDPPVGGGHA